ncbi:MAG TPA: hypothetical protein VF550_04840 [Polyangia bacterium]
MRRRDLPGGMVKLEVILSPDEAALVLTALDRAREVTHEQADDVSAETCARPAEDVSAETPTDATRPSHADGMVAPAESHLAGNVGTGNGGERFQVMVHVDQDPLAPDGILSGTLDGHIPRENLALPLLADLNATFHGYVALWWRPNAWEEYRQHLRAKREDTPADR